MADHARLIHLLDQASGVLRDIAPKLAAYYVDLVRLGVPPEQAIRLVRDVQARFIGDGSSLEDEVD